jgi:DNA polymerase I
MSNPLGRFREIIVADFEFVARNGERPDVVSLSYCELRSGRKATLWRDQLGKTPPYATSPDALFVGFFSSAELGCHRALGWPLPTNILDLYVEFSNEKNGKRKTGIIKEYGYALLGALASYKIETMGSSEKEGGRELVMKGDPWPVGEDRWSAGERREILAYNTKDTESTAQLFIRMFPGIDFPRALLRGRYMSAVSGMEHYGIPIDVPLLERMRSGWDSVQLKLIEDVDKDYGFYDGGHFRTRRFHRWLVKNKMGWPRLETGKLDLDDDAFERMSYIYPQVMPLRKLRQLLSELRLNDLRVGADGRNRCLISPFRSRTGRNQPSNTRFIFGPGKWIRGLIKPEPGWGVAYLDWEQQEFGIAAYLSGDGNMIRAYESGDPYLAFAKMAGAVPEWATKATHEGIRDLYKKCVLAIQYGKGYLSLAIDIGRHPLIAKDLILDHKQLFKRYWKWAENRLDWALLTGKQQTQFGWVNHVWHNVNGRSIQNFPMQANGGEMLRAGVCFGIENGIQVCAPVHDALLIAAPLERLEEDIERMQGYMRQASGLILGGPTLRTELAVVARHPQRFAKSNTAKNGKKGDEEKFWERITNLL